MRYFLMVGCLIALTVGALGASSLSRQELLAGDRVRFHTAPSPFVPFTYGEVVEVTDTALAVVILTETGLSPTPRYFAWERFSRLFVSVGKKPNTGTGALIGFTIGGVIGGVLGVSHGAVLRVDCESNCEPGVEDAVVGGIVLGGAGALLGAVFGAFVRTDRWVRVIPLGR